MVSRGVANDRDPGVVRHVQPLVGIGGPRIGVGETVCEMPQRRRHGGPQPERAVDVKPGVRSLADGGDDLRQRVERARVDVSGLGADEDRSVAEPGQHLAQPIGSHPALAVRLDLVDPAPAEAEHLERDVDRHVGLGPDDHGDLGGALKAVLLDGPAGSLQDAVAPRSQRRERRHRRAGREADR